MGVGIPFDGTMNRGKWAMAAANASRSQELYDHAGDDGPNWADGFENTNEAAAHPDVVAQLFAQLRSRFDTPSSDPWPPPPSAVPVIHSDNDSTDPDNDD
jgi:hypothetical protein